MKLRIETNVYEQELRLGAPAIINTGIKSMRLFQEHCLDYLVRQKIAL